MEQGLLEEMYERRRRSLKWTAYPQGIVPAWVADMDLPLAQEVIDAIIHAAENSDLGYPSALLSDEYLSAMSAWGLKRFGYEFPTAEMSPIGDVVQGIYWALATLTSTVKKVVTFTPAYPPFFRAITELNLELVDCPLVVRSNRYEIDVDAYRQAAQEARGGVLLLCSPHNPTGRLWSREELRILSDEAIRNEMTIISDEIHRDLVLGTTKHLATASISPDVANITVTLLSASKTFNLAGLHAAALHAPPSLAKKMATIPKGLLSGPSLLGMETAVVAYRFCAAWLDETLSVLRSNRDRVASWAQSLGIENYPPEATYMHWMRLEYPGRFQNAYEYLLSQARVALSPGADFDPRAAQFVRMNLATTPAVLEEILTRIEDLVKSKP